LVLIALAHHFSSQNPSIVNISNFIDLNKVSVTLEKLPSPI